jgi:hypothetical protein
MLMAGLTAYPFIGALPNIAARGASHDDASVRPPACR